MSFQEIVEEIRRLPDEEKAELRSLLEEELDEFSEEVVDELYAGHLEALKDYREGKLPPPISDVDELMRRIKGK